MIMQLFFLSSRWQWTTALQSWALVNTPCWTSRWPCAVATLWRSSTSRRWRNTGWIVRTPGISPLSPPFLPCPTGLPTSQICGPTLSSTTWADCQSTRGARERKRRMAVPNEECWCFGIDTNNSCPACALLATIFPIDHQLLIFPYWLYGKAWLKQNVCLTAKCWNVLFCGWCNDSSLAFPHGHWVYTKYLLVVPKRFEFVHQ